MKRRHSIVIFIHLLLLNGTPTSVRAFSEFMLSPSRCLTKLSTNATIMGSLVTAASESDDPSMHIELVEAWGDALVQVDTTLPFHVEVTVAALPVNLSLRVVTFVDKINNFYQWVMDVVTSNDFNATFWNGGCDGNRRLAGGQNETEPLQDNPGSLASFYGRVILTEELIISVILQVEKTPAPVEQNVTVPSHSKSPESYSNGINVLQSRGVSSGWWCLWCCLTFYFPFMV